MAKNIISFAELGKELICKKWGIEGENAKEVCERASADAYPKYMLAYLIQQQTEFLDKTEPLVDLLRKAFNTHMASATNQWYFAMRKVFNASVARREEKHGPCPGEVYREMYIRFKAEAAVHIDTYFRSGFIYASLYPPTRGSVPRKEYNRWMKRKAQKNKEEAKGND